MADLSITAASVAAGDSYVTCIAAAAVTAGQVVYKDPITGKFGLADCNSGTVAARTPYGIALNSAPGAGQPLSVQPRGAITPGATLTPGEAYYLSANPGAICPVGDLTSGMYPTILGIAVSASVLNLDIQPSGVSL